MGSVNLSGDGRFRVVDGSQSAHCCFAATVVDTTQPVMVGGEHYEGQFVAVCECFQEGKAKKIAEALNAAEEKGGSL